MDGVRRQPGGVHLIKEPDSHCDMARKRDHQHQRVDYHPWRPLTLRPLITLFAEP